MAATTPSPDPPPGTRPALTRPMWFAFVAFVVFVLFALLPDQGHRYIAVTPAEFEQLKKFTLFFIVALLPSDALIRFGRNILFTKVDDPDQAAKDAPASTLAQDLAFATFIVVALVVLGSDKLFAQDEAAKVIDVARTLVIALLPSDAAIRFGRAIYLHQTTPTTSTPSKSQLQKV